MEGGNRAGLIRRLGEIRDSGASVICLLAIADRGKPYYDAQVAGRIASMGIPCFACNPQKIPHLLERALKGLDLTAFQKEFEIPRWELSVKMRCSPLQKRFRAVPIRWSAQSLCLFPLQ